jgi:hypothetical protein
VSPDFIRLRIDRRVPGSFAAIRKQEHHERVGVDCITEIGGQLVDGPFFARMN